MLIKVNEASGIQLDYMVAKALGATNFHYDTVATYWVTLDGKDRALSKGWSQSFTPSTNWAQGGPIIEREKITLSDMGNGWAAGLNGTLAHFGYTPLIAAMRCFVSSKLGNEVEVPDALKA
jgi:hypothetical protein